MTLAGLHLSTIQSAVLLVHAGEETIWILHSTELFPLLKAYVRRHHRKRYQGIQPLLILCQRKNVVKK